MFDGPLLDSLPRRYVRLSWVLPPCRSQPLLPEPLRCEMGEVPFDFVTHFQYWSMVRHSQRGLRPHELRVCRATITSFESGMISFPPNVRPTMLEDCTE